MRVNINPHGHVLCPMCNEDLFFSLNLSEAFFSINRRGERVERGAEETLREGKVFVCTGCGKLFKTTKNGVEEATKEDVVNEAVEIVKNVFEDIDIELNEKTLNILKKVIKDGIFLEAL